MKYVPTLSKHYAEVIVPKMMKDFGYTSTMQVPRIVKIVLNQGVKGATEDRKLVEQAQTDLSNIAGQHAVITRAKKDINAFKVRRNMPIGTMVTLRRERMYEFLDRLINISLPRIRDFQGVPERMDGRGNYTLGITEQILFPEIDIDKIAKLMGIEITFVTSAKSDEEGLALLREFGIPFKTKKN